MKTLREWLFQQHESARSDLDQIRRQVVADLFRTAPADRPVGIAELPPPRTHLIPLLWHELIWPCRHAWIGLAGVWVLIFALNHACADSPVVVKSRSEALSPAMLTLLKEQRQLATDLEEPSPSAATDSPQPRLRPRSELEQAHHETV